MAEDVCKVKKQVHCVASATQNEHESINQHAGEDKRNVVTVAEILELDDDGLCVVHNKAAEDDESKVKLRLHSQDR